MKETVREARTVILDKSGKELPVPEGTDPHIKSENRKEETGKSPAIQPAGKKEERGSVSEDQAQS